MKLFAIRHVSGNYLTDKWQGSSYWEGEPYKGNPRLFSTEGIAKAWVTNWLKGQVRKTYNFVDEFANFDYVPVPSRKREHIQIIPVTLLFNTPT